MNLEKLVLDFAFGYILFRLFECGIKECVEIHRPKIEKKKCWWCGNELQTKHNEE